MDSEEEQSNIDPDEEINDQRPRARLFVVSSHND